VPRRDIAAKRYAQAILAIADDEGTLDRWQADLATLHALTAEPTVRAFLRSAKVEQSRKHTTLEQGLAGVDPKVISLAKLLVRKNRIDIVDQIAEVFGELLNTERGIVLSRVTTAVPLTDQGRSAVVQSIQRVTGATEVQLDEVVDRNILGGAVVQIGDHIVDGSVRSRLSGLRRTIAGSIT
jgi:F-type H+-transporting ATPase subunit delta